MGVWRAGAKQAVPEAVSSQPPAPGGPALLCVTDLSVEPFIFPD
jgi:hypothetical protein